MPNIINGSYSIKEVLNFTYQYAESRYEYKKRDVVKRIVIKEVREVSRHDIPGKPRIYTKYIIESKSFPQYAPYYTKKDSRGRSRKYQRTTSHHYDVTLEMDRLSLNTKIWKMRLGSGRIWDTHPPQSQIKKIYPENKKRWSRKRQESHKRRAKYLDIGDYNSQKLGINADFIFRQAYARYHHGHLFNRSYYGNVPSSLNPSHILFFTKHELNLIEVLMNQAILTDT